MTKRLAIGGLILWLLSQGCNVYGETDSSAEYLPLVDGNSWTYRVTGTDGTYNETMTVLPGTTVINGVATKAVQYSDGDIDYFTSDTNGIRYHRSYDATPPPIITFTFNPPLLYAHEKLSIPDTIYSSGIVSVMHETAGTFPLNYAATSEIKSLETVLVPAGTYETVRISDLTNMNGKFQGDTIDYSEWGDTWLAKHIGVIKQTFYDNDGGAEEWVMISTNVKPPVEEKRGTYLPFLPLLLD
jgi:hypothetical protein